MSRPASKYPTELELEIMKVLWRDGPSSVRQVRDALAEVRDLAYTSVMTVMGIMTEKGYLQRSKAKGGYVYRPQLSQESAQGGMVRDMVDRVFDGSAASLMLNLIESAELDADELKKMRDLIHRKSEEGVS